jgi:hypothetical protein
LNFPQVAILSGLWETVGMAKKKTPKSKLPKKRTPLQEIHTAEKTRKKQAQRTRQIYGDNLLEDLEGRSKEDVNQAAARTVRKLTEGK